MPAYIHRNSARTDELIGAAASAAERSPSRAVHVVHPYDPVVAGISDIDIPAAIQCDIAGTDELIGAAALCADGLPCRRAGGRR